MLVAELMCACCGVDVCLLRSVFMRGSGSGLHTYSYVHIPLRMFVRDTKNCLVHKIWYALLAHSMHQVSVSQTQSANFFDER